MIQVGIIGGAGYTAGELIRILLGHKYAKLNFVFSTSNAGNYLYDVHQDLLGSTAIKFTDKINESVDVVFLCLGHGNSKKFLTNHKFSSKTKIIDLSQDFRLKNDANFEGKKFVYGLPELNKDKIKQAQNIANPGCFATAIQLALLPLAKNNLLLNSVHINATTGATGVGVKPGATTHFSWRNNNFSIYKPFTHQHLAEINESLHQLQNNFNEQLLFIPNRGNFSRGIFATIYLKSKESLAAMYKLYKNYYKQTPFTLISENQIHLKQVVNTNNCIIHLEKIESNLLITVAIDNLLKGASGQAVQNMNLVFGFNENEGLKLKASVF